MPVVTEGYLGLYRSLQSNHFETAECDRWLSNIWELKMRLCLPWDRWFKTGFKLLQKVKWKALNFLLLGMRVTFLLPALEVIQICKLCLFWHSSVHLSIVSAMLYFAFQVSVQSTTTCSGFCSNISLASPCGRCYCHNSNFSFPLRLYCFFSVFLQYIHLLLCLCLSCSVLGPWSS